MFGHIGTCLAKQRKEEGGGGGGGGGGGNTSAEGHHCSTRNTFGPDAKIFKVL